MKEINYRLIFRIFDKKINDFCMIDPYIFVREWRVPCNRDPNKGMITDKRIGCCFVDTDDRYIFEQCTDRRDTRYQVAFENDIIKWLGELFVITWLDGRFVIKTGKFTILDFSTVDEFRIVGNIHENKELLEVSK